MKTYPGSCLCGAVKFEVQGQFDGFWLCHCKHCQKDTGSAHAANLFAQKATLGWLQGADQVTEFTLTGTRHQKSFCQTCGSAMPMQRSFGVVVPAGSLDCAVDIRPDGHIYSASRARWDDDLQALPVYTRLPN